VLGLKRPAVHFVGEDDLVAHRFLDGEAAFVGVGDVALDTLVEAGEHEFDCFGAESGVFEDPAERGAGPFGGADGLDEPGLADGTGVEEGAAVRAAADLIQVEGEGALHKAADVQAPICEFDAGDVEVDEEVVDAGGRDGVAERLQGHAAVAGGELYLLAVEVAGRGQAAAIADGRETAGPFVGAQGRLLFGQRVSPRCKR
jgi:hypothetical protein